ncbi:hypothetical protein AMS68_002509 [Peltaster fructicola]|uniref:BTB domain-containing protein n=1 Tax=Peltaster fructicola TaxID=286661 RepID=A0A6H0XQE6_9PEZI|nr:hypothetical protein AMS68_002509 [Peltaster fructicola]
MFSTSRSQSQRQSFSYRAGKATKKQRSFKDLNRTSRIITSQLPQASSPASSTPSSPNLNSAIITIAVGPTQRLFAAHEDVLRKSPFFAQACQSQFFENAGKRIELLTEEPEVFSAVLEFMYKGDYSPKLLWDKKTSSWSIDHDGGPKEITIQHSDAGVNILKDTVIYCSAHRYGLPELQRLALKKQGLQSGVQCSTILSSARFAYANTSPADSKLRAHYLALIIRSRNTFKRSGTMQVEMEAGGTGLFFDLFVALVNHLDDVVAAASKSPR